MRTGLSWIQNCFLVVTFDLRDRCWSVWLITFLKDVRSSTETCNVWKEKRRYRYVKWPSTTTNTSTVLRWRPGRTKKTLRHSVVSPVTRIRTSRRCGSLMKRCVSSLTSGAFMKSLSLIRVKLKGNQYKTGYRLGRITVCSLPLPHVVFPFSVVRINQNTN